jgi:hypothetical protein
MTLFEGEQILLRTKGDHLLVTTHRVRDESESEFTSIMLEEVCSVRTTKTAHRWLLVLAAPLIALVAYSAVAFTHHEISPTLAVIAGVLVVAYFVTRYSVVEVASAGARIRFEMSRANEVAEFVDTVESAKNARYMLRTTASRSETESLIATQ